MAQVPDPRWYAHDDDGNPLVGATLTVYTANTVTPAAIWRDAALTVPMSNPIAGADASDAGGMFPQWWAAEGLVFDIDLKDAEGNLVRPYVDVSPAGADTGEFARTLADDTRLRFTGSGGRVLMRAGSPDPDDTGGKLTIEGWDGTQLDDVLLDAALIDTTGPIKESGKKIIGVVHTEATTLTAVTNFDIALPNSPTGVRAWEIEVFDLYGSAIAGDALALRVSYDGGATFKSGASDYSDINIQNTFTVGSSAGGSATGTQVTLARQFRTAANRPARFFMRVTTPNSGSDATIIDFRGIYTDHGNSGAMATQETGAHGLGGYGRATDVRLFMIGAGGTLTGKYLVKPLRGFGET